jgi:hypothetical protein
MRFPSLDEKHHYELSGTLYTPANATTPFPAVVVIHGTMGIDSRNEFYREAIPKEGIATFEVDFKSGIYSSPPNRPHPSAFVPMVFAAHVAFFPVCKPCLQQEDLRVTGAPRMIRWVRS